MAHMNTEKKKLIAPKIKAICEKYGVKGSLSVRHYSTLVLNIRSGSIDFITNYNQIKSTEPYGASFESRMIKGYIDVNTFHYEKNFSGIALDFLKEIVPAMNVGNYDRSDIQSDYFDVGWYIDINIGQWDSPYFFNNEIKRKVAA